MPMTTPIEPGPLSIGIASGVNETSCLCAASACSWREIPRLRKQHAKADVADDETARDAQARDRNTEEAHGHAARNEKRREDAEHVDTGATDLRAALRLGELLRDRHDDPDG